LKLFALVGTPGTTKTTQIKNECRWLFVRKDCFLYMFVDAMVLCLFSPLPPFGQVAVADTADIEGHSLCAHMRARHPRDSIVLCGGMVGASSQTPLV